MFMSNNIVYHILHKQQDRHHSVETDYLFIYLIIYLFTYYSFIYVFIYSFIYLFIYSFI